MNKKEDKQLHGLAVRWAYVPYKEKPNILKKRPVVVLYNDTQQKISYILRITSKFDEKSVYEKMNRFCIGKMNPLRKNGLTKKSYIDLSEAQELPNSLFLKKGFVGYLSVFSSIQMMKAGYKYQKYNSHSRLRNIIDNFKDSLIKAIPKNTLNKYKYSKYNFYSRNKKLTNDQRNSMIKYVSSKVNRVKKLNHKN